jgi:hypothetical protein
VGGRGHFVALLTRGRIKKGAEEDVPARLKGTVPRDFRLQVFSLISLPPVSTTPAVPVAKVALTCKYLREFSKKFEMTLMLFSGALGKMIHEKT